MSGTELPDLIAAAELAAETLTRSSAALRTGLDLAARSVGECYGVLAAIPGSAGWAQAAPLLDRVVDGLEAAERANLAAMAPRLWLRRLAAALREATADDIQRTALTVNATGISRAPDLAGLLPVAERLRGAARRSGTGAEPAQVRVLADRLAEQRRVARALADPAGLLATLHAMAGHIDATEPGPSRTGRGSAPGATAWLGSGGVAELSSRTAVTYASRNRPPDREQAAETGAVIP